MAASSDERARNEALWASYNFDDYEGRFAGFTYNMQQIAALSMKPAVRIQVGPPGSYKGCLAIMPNGDLIATPMNPDITGMYRSLVYRSVDDGLSWEQVAAPADLPGKEHGLAALSDGTLLHVSNGISRSEDGGKTWEACYTQLPGAAFSRNVEERPDGSLLLIGVNTKQPSAERLLLCTSHDRGRSWDAKEVPVESDYPVFRGYDLEGRLMAEEPSWLTLPDGRLLCTYANYHLPYGIFAILSDDLGTTWDLGHPIMLALSGDFYTGWPTTVQLAGGSFVTCYAIAAYLGKEAKWAFQVVRWELPD